MHEYKTYKIKHQNGKESLYGACCKCGSIEVKNPDRTNLVCSGKMHENSTVKVCNMKLFE